MRLRSLAPAIMAIAGMAFAGTRSADHVNADHLTPVDRSDERINKYRSLLISKLGLSLFDCGRVVDTPSFGTETVVSVYSQMRSGRRLYYVTSVQAVANLWQGTNSMRDPAKAETIGIQRIDAEIAEPIAEKIKEIWTKMLQNARPAPPLGSEFVMSGYLDFSIQKSGRSELYGELRLPAAGPKTQALVKITDELWEYCKATRARRGVIANNLDHEATRLLAQLN